MFTGFALVFGQIRIFTRKTVALFDSKKTPSTPDVYRAGGGLGKVTSEMTLFLPTNCIF